MPDKPRNTIYIAGILLIISILFILTLIYFIDIITILIISILISMIFNPIVSSLENKGFERKFSVTLIFIINSIIFFFAGSFLIPKLLSQINNFTKLLTSENIKKVTQGIENFVHDYFPFINTETLVVRLQNLLNSLFVEIINNFSQIISSFFNLIIIAVIIPFITFFLLRDNKLLLKGFVNLFPNKYLEFSYLILNKTGIQLGQFIRGWLLDATIVGTLIALALSLSGIKNSITIGLIAGLGHLVPYFGPIIGGIPAIILSIIQYGDLTQLPKILFIFSFIYLLDNGFIQPKIYSHKTGFHPILIIIFILIGNQIFGPIGMLLAIPLATVIKTASSEFYSGFKNFKIIKM